MRDSELADPYVTPRTLPARRSLKVLAFVIILAVVSLSASATAFMFYRAASSSMQLDRAYPVTVPSVERGPVTLEIPITEGLPTSGPETAVP